MSLTIAFICCVYRMPTTRSADSLNCAIIGQKAKTIKTGTLVAVAACWFSEKIPIAAPGTIDVAEPYIRSNTNFISSMPYAHGPGKIQIWG